MTPEAEKEIIRRLDLLEEQFRHLRIIASQAYAIAVMHRTPTEYMRDEVRRYNEETQTKIPVEPSRST